MYVDYGDSWIYIRNFSEITMTQYIKKSNLAIGLLLIGIGLLLIWSVWGHFDKLEKDKDRICPRGVMLNEHYYVNGSDVYLDTTICPEYTIAGFIFFIYFFGFIWILAICFIIWGIAVIFK